MSAEAYLDVVLSIWKEQGDTSTCKLSGFSMAPLLQHGDTLLIEHRPGKVRIGDVIIFKASEKLLVHRVIHKKRTKDGEFILAKGDQSRVIDQPITPGQVIGKVLEVRGSSGHLRLKSKSWTLANYGLAALSRLAAKNEGAGRALWNAARLIQLTRSRQLVRAIRRRFRADASRETGSHQT